MLILKLAVRNITHAGVRTWLNVLALSVAFVAIVATEGLYEGTSEQIKRTEIESNMGGGQFWQKDYDPLNPFSYEISHSEIADNLKREISNGNAAAVLIAPAAIFPRRVIQSVLLKGIDPGQKIINLPSYFLKENSDTNSIPAIIGKRMAENLGIKEGDYISTRWKNIKGTFDAADLHIIKVVELNSPMIDKDQFWIPLKKLQAMMQATSQATIIILNKNIETIPAGNSIWIFKDHNFLLKDINLNIERKKIYSSFLYIILIGMALLAIFDTQVLSIFKRRKEMGTLMALGMTKLKIIGLFTIEGCITGILSFIAGSIYGIPILYYLSIKGIGLPQMVQQSQFAIGLVIYPKYGVRLYLMTTLILFISVVVVSFLPTHRISKLKPTDALKGKLS